MVGGTIVSSKKFENWQKRTLESAQQQSSSGNSPPTMSDTVQTINSTKGNPYSVTEAAAKIVQKANNTKTVILEEIIIYRQTLAPASKGIVEMIFEGAFSSNESFKPFKMGLFQESVLRATKALNTVPVDFVQTGFSIDSDVGIGLIGAFQYRTQTRTYTYGSTANIQVIRSEQWLTEQFTE
jgi:hypothetical protein